jgi:hypothetical protein
MYTKGTMQEQMMPTPGAEQIKRDPTLEMSDEAIVAFLKDNELATDNLVLTPTNIERIRARAQTIVKDHPEFTNENALKLAFFDRAIYVLREYAANDESLNTDITEALDPRLATPFVKNSQLAHDQEFLKTVVRKAAVLFKQGGYVSFTDALPVAADLRVAELKKADVIATVDQKTGVAKLGFPERDDEGGEGRKAA